MEQPKSLGRHLLAEFYDCNLNKINNRDFIELIMVESAKKAGATVVDRVFHEFSPYGISGVVVIAESHLAIHTWPEHGYAAVDLFTCGLSIDPYIAFHYLSEQLEAKDSETHEILRGHLSRFQEKD